MLDNDDDDADILTFVSRRMRSGAYNISCYNQQDGVLVQGEGAEWWVLIDGGRRRCTLPYPTKAYAIRVAQVVLKKVYADSRNGVFQPSPVKKIEYVIDRSTAIKILDIKGDRITSDIVESQHLRMIKKFHPDNGGTNFFASQINLARETLMKEVR